MTRPTFLDHVAHVGECWTKEQVIDSDTSGSIAGVAHIMAIGDGAVLDDPHEPITAPHLTVDVELRVAARL